MSEKKPPLQRIYVVRAPNAAPRLVRANHPDRARSHVASDIEVEVASQEDLVTLLPGTHVEDSRRDAAQPELPLTTEGQE